MNEIEEKEKVLIVGKMLLMYRNYLNNHPEYKITEEIILYNYANDPVFKRVVDCLIEEDSL